MGKLTGSQSGLGENESGEEDSRMGKLMSMNSEEKLAYIMGGGERRKRRRRRRRDGERDRGWMGGRCRGTKAETEIAVGEHWEKDIAGGGDAHWEQVR